MRSSSCASLASRLRSSWATSAAPCCSASLARRRAHACSACRLPTAVRSAAAPRASADPPAAHSAPVSRAPDLVNAADSSLTQNSQPGCWIALDQHSNVQGAALIQALPLCHTLRASARSLATLQGSAAGHFQVFARGHVVGSANDLGRQQHPRLSNTGVQHRRQQRTAHSEACARPTVDGSGGRQQRLRLSNTGAQHRRASDAHMTQPEAATRHPPSPAAAAAAAAPRRSASASMRAKARRMPGSQRPASKQCRLPSAWNSASARCAASSRTCAACVRRATWAYLVDSTRRRRRCTTRCYPMHAVRFAQML